MQGRKGYGADVRICREMKGHTGICRDLQDTQGDTVYVKTVMDYKGYAG